MQHVELVFGTNFRDLTDAREFQTILPKRLIHHMLDDRPAAFFADWRQSLLLARGVGSMSWRGQWRWAGQASSDRFGWRVATRARILKRGYLVLRDPLLAVSFDAVATR